MLKAIQTILQKKSNILVWIVYAFAILFISARNLSLPWGDLFANGGFYSHYNNFIIFKKSFFHLVNNQNLYIHYPLEQYDLFKYPPTFALLFAPFSLLPDFLGYTLWTALNLLLPVFAIFKLKAIGKNGKLIIVLLLVLEAFTSALNSQSNGLMLGLILLAVVALEGQKFGWAVLCIWLTVFIKLFGILFFVLFLFYPGAIRKSLIWIILLFAIFLLLPLPIIGWDGLLFQYKSMFNLLSHDHSSFVKYSVMGWLKQWFHLYPSKNMVLILGLFIQLLPILYIMIKNNLWKSNSLLNVDPKSLHKLRFIQLTSLLLWVVIFNHMAESATYIIAVGGSLLFLFGQESEDRTYMFQTNKTLSFALLILILFTVLGPTDIYPRELRFWIVETAQLKAFPCIFLWGIMIYESWRLVK